MDIKSFRTAFHGKVFEPSDVGYNEARQIWNASVSKHPSVIVQCAGVADVIAAVNFARANNLLTAIRGGGHNVGGRALCDDGLVIDLSPMRSVFVDAATDEFEYKAAQLSVILIEKRMFSGLQFRAA